MKASELIEELKEIIKYHGDQEVYYEDQFYKGKAVRDVTYAPAISRLTEESKVEEFSFSKEGEQK